MLLFSRSVIVQLLATPQTAAHQASLSFSISQRLLKLMSIEFWGVRWGKRSRGVLPSGQHQCRSCRDRDHKQARGSDVLVPWGWVAESSRGVSPHSTGGWRPEIRVSAEPGFPEGSGKSRSLPFSLLPGYMCAHPVVSNFLQLHGL